MSSSTTSGDPRPARPLGEGPVIVLGADEYSVGPVGPARQDGNRYEPAERVTSARGSHSDDVGRRMRTYAISMGIRTLCVLLAILSFPNWWAWLFVPGAVVLPYVAVVLANVGGERAPTGPVPVPSTVSPLPVLRVPGPGTAAG